MLVDVITSGKASAACRYDNSLGSIEFIDNTSLFSVIFLTLTFMCPVCWQRSLSCYYKRQVCSSSYTKCLPHFVHHVYKCFLPLSLYAWARMKLVCIRRGGVGPEHRRNKTWSAKKKNIWYYKRKFLNGVCSCVCVLSSVFCFSVYYNYIYYSYLLSPPDALQGARRHWAHRKKIQKQHSVRVCLFSYNCLYFCLGLWSDSSIVFRQTMLLGIDVVVNSV